MMLVCKQMHLPLVVEQFLLVMALLFSARFLPRTGAVVQELPLVAGDFFFEPVGPEPEPHELLIERKVIDSYPVIDHIALMQPQAKRPDKLSECTF